MSPKSNSSTSPAREKYVGESHAESSNSHSLKNPTKLGENFANDEDEETEFNSIGSGSGQEEEEGEGADVEEGKGGERKSHFQAIQAQLWYPSRHEQKGKAEAEKGKQE